MKIKLKQHKTVSPFAASKREISGERKEGEQRKTAEFGERKNIVPTEEELKALES